MFKQIACGMLLAACLLTVTPLHAELPPEALAAMNKGVLAAKQQEWEIAIQSFQEARKAAPNAPELFYNLGLAESKIPGRELRAISWFGAYLAANPSAPNADAVRDLVAGLQIKSQGNIFRMIKIVQEADGLIPDAPITHDNGITGFTNKPDIDRVMGLYKVADLWASAGNSANAIDLAHRIGAAGYNQSASLGEIVAAQASAGRVEDAIKTATSWYDVVNTNTAQLNIAAAQIKAGDVAAARATLATAQSTAAGVQSAYVRNSQLGDIAKAQAEIGDIPSAQRTAGLIPSPQSRSWSEIFIARAQADAGDLARAQASLLAAQQGVDLWKSWTNAQKTAACECVVDPHENMTDLELLIAGGQIDVGDIDGARATLVVARKEVAADPGDKSGKAYQIVESQVKAGDIPGAQVTVRLISQPDWQGNNANRSIAIAQAEAGDVAGASKTAELITDKNTKYTVDNVISEALRRTKAAASASASGSQTPAAQRAPTPPRRVAPPPSPDVSLADWTGELDRLNTPLFLNLAEALKTPQATYKTIYTGSSGFEDSNNDPKKAFEALAGITEVVISAKNTIDHMLERQARQKAQQ